MLVNAKTELSEIGTQIENSDKCLSEIEEQKLARSRERERERERERQVLLRERRRSRHTTVFERPALDVGRRAPGVSSV
jgi:hypothetical protein